MNKKLHLYKLALLAVLTLPGTALTAAAADYDFVYNNVYFKITSTTNKTVEVVQKPNGYCGAWIIPDDPVYNGVTWTCTAIGDRAFCGLHGLEPLHAAQHLCVDWRICV